VHLCDVFVTIFDFVIEQRIVTVFYDETEIFVIEMLFYNHFRFVMKNFTIEVEISTSGTRQKITIMVISPFEHSSTEAFKLTINLQPCFPSIARLKFLISLKPIPPRAFGYVSHSQLSQWMRLLSTELPHQ
jgi:hypothetical protein